MMLLFLILNLAFAQTPIDEDAIAKEVAQSDAKVIEALGRVRNQIETASQNQSKCLVDRDENKCSFGEICASAAKNPMSSHLEVTPGGELLPNFALREIHASIYRCGGVDGSDSFPGDTVYNVSPFLTPAEEKELKPVLETKSKLTQELALEVKIIIKKIIDEKFKNYSPKIRSNLKSRIDSVGIITPTMDNLSEMYMMGCDSPNAFYMPINHSVYICPQILENSASTVMAILAHEMGHAIDPCSIGLDLHQNGEAETPENSYAANVNPIMPNDWILGKKQISAVSLKDSPYQEILTCFMRSNSMGLKKPSLEKAEADFNIENYSDEEREYLSSSSFQEEKKSSREAFLQHPYCGIGENDKHFLESFSDWIMAETIAKKIETLKGPAKKSFALASMGQFIGTLCPSLVDKIKDIYIDQLKGLDVKRCPDIAELLKEPLVEKENLSHPSTDSRMNKIFLTHPKIAEAVGCGGKSPYKYCP